MVDGGHHHNITMEDEIVKHTPESQTCQCGAQMDLILTDEAWGREAHHCPRCGRARVTTVLQEDENRRHGLLDREDVKEFLGEDSLDQDNQKV